MVTHDLESERARMLASGCVQVSVAEMDRRFRAFGYRLDRSRYCRGTTRIMTGPNAGSTYPATTAGATHIMTGLSFSHADAPRDEHFRAFQHLRQTMFAVVRGTILSV